jgi:hypothetical protein
VCKEFHAYVRHQITFFPRRLLQNRESAFRFRIKRKSEFDTLRLKVKDLVD